MRPALALAAAISLGGCGHLAAISEVTTYNCADGSTVTAGYRGKQAVIHHRGKSHHLTIQPSASGARYTGDGVQWWTKGLTEGALSPLKPGEAIAAAEPMACAAPT